MSSQDSIEVTGIVKDQFPNATFSVDIGNSTILATLSGKLRRNNIRILVGDRVNIELSPYDLTKGRITFRHK